MSYTINPNAKNKWARNAENTMDLSLETDASSVYLDNGRTLEQELGEGSMVSNVVTIDNSISKVIDGTLNGAYESGVMYGKTMVNGLSNPKIRQGREYITMVSPTHLIINHGENLSEKKISVNYDWFGGKMEDGADYTLDIWILKNTMHRKTDSNATIGKFNFNSYNAGFYSIPANTLGHITYEVTTSKVNTGGGPYIETFNSCEGELEIQIVVRQGKNLTPIEQHFEGLCDAKMPILRNTGKNLFDGELENGNFNGGTNNLRSSIFELKELTRYTISNDMGYSANVTFHDKNDNYISEISSSQSKFAFETPLGTKYVWVRTWSNQSDLNVKFQIEEGSVATSYEPYKTNILHTPETVTLRNLPNGVRDELNLKTGEYIKRIGEVVLNGDEDWKAWESNDTHCKLSLANYPSNMRLNGQHTTRLVCDKLKISSDRVGVVNDNFMASVGDAAYTIIVGLELGKLTSANVAGFKQWLKENPLTVQYELATPITTTIEPLSIPFAYENGHIVLESGYEGQSLLPTLEYSTVINRTGQIQSIANTIQKQEKQITKLEQMLIQNIINLDYNNTLLTLKNEMEEML